MIVRENIEFERGKDPKKALDIGIASKFEPMSEIISWEMPYAKVIKKFMGVPYENIFQLKEYQSGSANRALCNTIIMKFNDGKETEKTEAGAGVTIELAQTENGKMAVYYDSWVYAIYGDIKAASWWIKFIKTNENIEFERGKDPKKALGIGTVSKIQKGFRELKKKGYSNFDTFYDDEGAKDLYLEIHFGEVTFITENEMKEDVENVFPGMLEYEFARVWKLFYKIKRKYAFYFEEALYNIRHGISESMEFERGRDPYGALDIGIKDVKQLGPLAKRSKHVLKRDGHTSVSRGYMMWKLLNFIKGKNDKGEPVGYKDCVEYYYQKLKGEGYRRSFSIGPWENLQKYISRDENRKYTVNWSGRNYLKKYSFFDDGRETLEENIKFERGRDPKEAMKIGREDIRLIKILQKNADRFGYEKLEDVNDAMDPENWVANVDVIAVWKKPKTEEEVVLIYNKDESEYQVVGFCIDPDINDIDELRTPNEPYMWYDSFYWEAVLNPELLNESADFERGKSPKEAMEIGIETQLKNRSLRNLVDPASHAQKIAAEIGAEFHTNIDLDKIYSAGNSEFDDEISAKLKPHMQDPHTRTKRSTGLGVNIYTYNTPYGKIVGESPGWGRELFWTDRETILNLIYDKTKAKTVQESIEFERGVDPKRAMKIGNSEKQMEYEIERAIDEFVGPLADGEIQMDWDYSDDMEVYRELNAWVPLKDKESRNRIKNMLNSNDYDQSGLFNKIFDLIEEEGYQLGNYKAFNWGTFKKKGIQIRVQIQ